LTAALKYQVDQLASEALALLSSVFSTSFEEWNNASKSSHTLRIHDVDSLPALLKLIKLGHSHGDSAIQALLPAAYLRLCLHREVSSVFDQKPSPEILRRFTVGRSSVLSKFIREGSLGCDRRCNPWITTTALRTDMIRRATLGELKPLFQSRGQLTQSIRAILAAGTGHVECKFCMEWLTKNLKTIQRSAWDDLPKSCGIADDWSQIESLRGAGAQRVSHSRNGIYPLILQR
jgi:hypothetical protein